MSSGGVRGGRGSGGPRGAPRGVPSTMREVLSSIMQRPDVKYVVAKAREKAAQTGTPVVLRIPVQRIMANGVPVQALRVQCNPPAPGAAPSSGAVNVSFDTSDGSADAARAASVRSGAAGATAAAERPRTPSPPPPPPPPAASVDVALLTDEEEAQAGAATDGLRFGDIGQSVSDTVRLAVTWRVASNASTAKRFVLEFASAAALLDAEEAAKAARGGAGGARHKGKGKGKGKKGKKKAKEGANSKDTEAGTSAAEPAAVQAAYHLADEATAEEMATKQAEGGAPAGEGEGPGPLRRCVLKDVDRGMVYVVRVCFEANDPANGSDLIECGRATITTPPGRPSAPGAPSSAGASRTGLKVRWQRASERGSPIVEYVLEMAPAGGAYAEVYRGPEVVTSISGLLPGSRWTFRVLATNEIGCSDWSDVSELATSASVPLPPRTLRVVAASPRSVQLSWEAPMRDNGAPVTAYALEVSDESRDGDFRPAYTGSSTHFEHTGLTPDSEYRYRVRATNAVGNSEYSEVCETRTHGCAPEAPTGLCLGTDPSKRRSDDPRCARLEWRTPEGAVGDISYELQLSEGPDNSFRTEFEGGVTSFVFTRLDPGTRYSARVRAHNQFGWGPFCEELKFTTGSAPPSAPAPPVLRSVEPHSAQITWNEPALHGAALRGYELFVRRADSRVQSRAVVSGDRRAPRAVALRQPEHPSWRSTLQRALDDDDGEVQIPLVPFEANTGVASQKAICARVSELLQVSRGADGSAGAEESEADGTTWKVGDNCDAIYEEDGLWYAGSVSDVVMGSSGDPEAVVVTFAGYGNVESVKPDNLRPRLRIGSACEAVSPEDTQWHRAIVDEVLTEGYTVRIPGLAEPVDVPSAAVRECEASDLPTEEDATQVDDTDGAATPALSTEKSWATMAKERSSASVRPLPQQPARKLPASDAGRKTSDASAAGARDSTGATVATRGGAGAATNSSKTTVDPNEIPLDGTPRLAFRGSRRQCVVKDLIPGHDYEVRVRCSNEAGTSELSAPLSFSAKAAPPTPPQGITVTSATVDTLEYSIAEVLDDHGDAVTRWRVQLAHGETDGSAGAAQPGGRLVYHDTMEVTSPRGVVPSLASGRIYWLKAAACNAQGASDWCIPVRAQTRASVPTPPGSVRCTRFVAESADAVVASVKTAVGSVMERVVRGAEGGATLHHSCDLLPTLSAVATRKRAGQAPQGTQVIAVAWNPPASANGSSLVGYRVELATRSPSRSGRAVTFTCAYDGPSSQILIVSPPVGESLSVRVAARNGIGIGPFCDAVDVSAEAIPPSAVCDVDVSATSHNGAVVTWSEPENGGAEIVAYTLQRLVLRRKRGRASGGAGGDAPTVPASPSASSIVELTLRSRTAQLKKLTPSTHYAVRVAASNSAGLGSFSDWIVLKTAPPPAAPPPVPKQPTFTELFRSESHVVLRVSWAPTASATSYSMEFDGDQLFRVNDGVVGAPSSKGPVYEGGDTSVDVQLPTGTAGRFRVAALNEHGRSKPCEWTTAPAIVADKSGAGGASSASPKSAARRTQRAKANAGAEAAKAPSLAAQQKRISKVLRDKRSGRSIWVWIVGGVASAVAAWWIFADNEAQ